MWRGTTTSLPLMHLLFRYSGMLEVSDATLYFSLLELAPAVTYH